MPFNPKQHPHRRKNLLTGEWVLVSPQRSQRPWQGQKESPDAPILPSYDASCYLCPGNTRAGGKINPDYEGTYVFANDFPALLPSTGALPPEDDLLQMQAESGICRVICYHPNHSFSFAHLNKDQIEEVIHTWQEQYRELSQKPKIAYVQIFENKGKAMGCSNPHPHGQIWASSSIPDLPATEGIQQKNYFEQHQKTLLSSYLKREIKEQCRVLYENDSMAVLLPFWAVWPYETMVLPKRPQSRLTEMNAGEIVDLAEALSKLTRAYDGLFDCSFPYSMGIHQAPCHGEFPEWHWHFHFLPPLLRSATVRKFMVGFELMAWPQRDLSAEEAAARLRKLF